MGRIPKGLKYEYVTDEETGEKCVKLPVDDFEELMEQFGQLPEVLQGLEEFKAGQTIPWEVAREQIDRQEREADDPQD